MNKRRLKVLWISQPYLKLNLMNIFCQIPKHEDKNFRHESFPDLIYYLHFRKYRKHCANIENRRVVKCDTDVGGKLKHSTPTKKHTLARNEPTEPPECLWGNQTGWRHILFTLSLDSKQVWAEISFSNKEITLIANSKTVIVIKCTTIQTPQY